MNDSDDAARYGEAGEPIVSSWDEQDLGPVLDGTLVVPEPTLFTRTDGISLLYPGLIHSFHGEPESGKSLAMQWLAAQVLLDGGTVLYLDHESDGASVVARLLLFGAEAAGIRQRFHYVHPETGHGALWDRAAWEDHLARPTTFAVIDGVTDALGLFGYSQQSNDDIAAWMRLIPRSLAARTGAAVALVDHVTKDGESRGRFAIGGQAKLAGLTGAAYTVEVKRPLGRGLLGEIALRVAKDRPGYVRAHGGPMRHDRTQEVARVLVDSTGPVLTLTVQPPTGSSEEQDGGGSLFRPTTLMEKVSRLVESSTTPATFRTITGGIRGKEKDVRNACEVLVVEGWISREDGPRNSHLHRSIRAYRARQDPLSDTYEPPLDDRLPTVSPPSPGDGETTVSLSPVYRDRRRSHAPEEDPEGTTVSRRCSKHGAGLIPSVCMECRGLSERRAAS
ncbi:AAA family ATPase [Oryzobacter sp. R7]|uniref:AAA family ATPase n=1 Tax=Oryzobacter faecalis TaxID=3388656 RepID=UPI00398D47B2